MSSINLCFQLTCTTHDPATRIYTTSCSIFRWASLSNDDTKGLGRRLLNIRQKTDLFGRSPPNDSIEEMIYVYYIYPEICKNQNLDNIYAWVEQVKVESEMTF